MALILNEKVFMLTEYADFAKASSNESAKMLSEKTSNKKYTIKLVEGKQSA